MSSIEKSSSVAMEISKIMELGRTQKRELLDILTNVEPSSSLKDIIKNLTGLELTDEVLLTLEILIKLARDRITEEESIKYNLQWKNDNNGKDMLSKIFEEPNIHNYFNGHLSKAA